jgi:8-oxo-dGTP pyrophosphatase MutT (NUDIX family)
MPDRTQVAALPIRRGKNGAIEVLLVTSRCTGRWLLPKGWTCKRLKDHQAAAREARQEAGVDGKITARPIGHYRYFKTELGFDSPVEVAVYVLNVKKQLKKWREKDERQRAWFSPVEAASLVLEPGLAELIFGMGEVPKGWKLGRRKQKHDSDRKESRGEVIAFPGANLGAFATP